MKKDLVTSWYTFEWNFYYFDINDIIMLLCDSNNAIHLLYIVLVYATQETKAQVFQAKRALFNLSVVVHATHVV